jgi:hypothetical protein
MRWPARTRLSLPRGALLIAVWLAGCTSLGDDVRRAERAFGEARYEDVQVWLADLAPSLGDMPAPMRARYYYLDGMSAFRIGQRARARHALALCREELTASDQDFPAAWRQNLEQALAEL